MTERVSNAILCVHGHAAATWLEQTVAGVPAGVRVVAVNASTPIELGDRTLTALALRADAGILEVLRHCAASHPGRDLVLLQAGTELPAHWLERLLTSLDHDAVLAVSPLDNIDPARAPLPPGARSSASVAAIDRGCFLYGRHQYVDTASISPLLSAWHGGRLVEADLAHLRELAVPPAWAPLRAVLLDYLYVAAPQRELSGPAPRRPGADALAPSALGELREQLAAALEHGGGERGKNGLPGLDGRPVILHILHGWGGGAERFVRDLAASDTTRCHLVLLARGNVARRQFGEAIELLDGDFSMPALRRLALAQPIAATDLQNRAYAEFMATVIADFGVAAIMVSSLIGHSLDALRTGLPLLVVGHDFYPLWPILHRNFGDPALAFDTAQLHCDLNDASLPQEFSERDPAYWSSLRTQYVAALLKAHATVVAPSRSAMHNLLRIEPRLQVLTRQVIGHGLAPWRSAPTLPLPAPPRRARLRLLLPGRIRRGKGADLLHQALPALREYAEIFLLGAGAEGEQFFGERDVHVVLDYARDDLPALVALIAPDAALLLPTVAETFSYTLSEMNSLAVPVIGTNLGSLAERIEDGLTGWLVEPTPAAIVRTVAQLGADRDGLEQVRLNLQTLPVKSLASMAQAYRDLLPIGTLPSTLLAHAAGSDHLQLAELYASRGDSERTQTLLRERLTTQQRELEQRSDWASGLDRELKHAVRVLHRRDRELDERTTWAQSLQQDIQSARVALSGLRDEFDERTGWALAQAQRIGELEHLLQTLEQLRQQREADYDALAQLRDQITQQRDAFESDRNRLLASRSWRLTKPLRWLARRVRSARIRAAFMLTRMRSMHGRVRGSLARRGLKGTLARAAQELTPAAVFEPSLPVAEPTQNFTPHALPTSAAPLVSIVIPVYNKFAYTDACLRSLSLHAAATPFEVIVVDDGSSDDTAVCLALIDGIVAIRNAENLGFVGSCNAGAAQARGDYVLFLNNDTVVTPGWLEALLEVFQDIPEAGLAGARLIYPDGRLQEAGGIIFSDGSGWNYGRFDDPAAPQFNYRRDADYCSGAAIMLPRALFEQLGGFDTRYAPAYYEDTDLAFAVRAAGRRVIYEPRASVIHFEGITAGTDVGSGTKRYQVINQQKFLAKWQGALNLQPAPGTRIEIAREHRRPRRALIIDACVPAPDQDSGSLRMVNLMRVLIDLDYKVSFFADNRAYDEKYTPPLQRLGVEALYNPYLDDVVKFFREHGSLFDAIVVSRHYIAVNYVELIRLYAPQARLVFDTVDLHYLREERAAALIGNGEIAREAAKTKAQELKLMRDCDVTLVVSPVERDLLARELPGVRIEVLSNVHEVFGCRRGFAQRQDLVFVGGFQHPPNIDAVLFFVRDVFPHVRAELPEVRFHVIGSKAPAEILELQAEGVIVHGYLPEITEYMDGARLSIAPLRYGAGVKGKVNMAMSYGLPVVATTIAVEGMHVVEGQDVLVADDPQQLATLIVRAYREQGLWETLSANGLENVRRHFSFAAARSAVEQILH